jgi:hypothetical protein
MEEDDSGEPSILHVLNEDYNLILYRIVFYFLFFYATMGSTCGTLSHRRAIELAGILRKYDVSRKFVIILRNLRK